MFTYEYTLLDQKNTLHRGIVRAIGKRSAAKKIAFPQLTLVTLSKTKRQGSLFGFLRRGVSRMERIIFTRNLMTMMRAGMNITEALDSSREQTTSPILKRIIAESYKAVMSGQPLAESLAKYEHIFTPTYIAMIRIGERGGKLINILEYLTREMENDLKLQRKVRNALVYPGLILATMVAMVTLMMFFVIPKIAAIYADSNAPLPIYTSMLISISRFVGHNGAYIIAILIALILLFRQEYRHSYAFRKFIHKILLRMPIFSEITKKINLTVISGSLSMLTHAGLSIDESLVLAGKAAPNILYQEAIIKTVPFIKRGVNLSVIFKGNPDMFLPVFLKMVATGEQTGNLDDMFAHISAYYDEDISHWTSNMSTLIEPALLLGTGVVIGGIAFAVIYPLWNFASII